MENRTNVAQPNPLRVMAGKVTKWLNEDSKLYTRICEEPTKRITVIRVNLISAMVLLGIICCEQHLLVSFGAMLAAGYLVGRLK